MAEQTSGKIEAEPKLEWGSDFDDMSWDDAQAKIIELNSKLVNGEKLWRLPTQKELYLEFKKAGSIPAGFQSGYYWSSTRYSDDPDSAEYNAIYVFLMDKGLSDFLGPGFADARVRLVRDAA